MYPRLYVTPIPTAGVFRIVVERRNLYHEKLQVVCKVNASVVIVRMIPGTLSNHVCHMSYHERSTPWNARDFKSIHHQICPSFQSLRHIVEHAFMCCPRAHYIELHVSYRREPIASINCTCTKALQKPESGKGARLLRTNSNLIERSPENRFVQYQVRYTVYTGVRSTSTTILATISISRAVTEIWKYLHHLLFLVTK